MNTVLLTHLHIPQVSQIARVFGGLWVAGNGNFFPKPGIFVAKMVCWIMVARRIPAFGDDGDYNDQSYCCKVRITIY